MVEWQRDNFGPGVIVVRFQKQATVILPAIHVRFVIK